MTGAIIQARMSSSRLPGKVLLPLAGKPVLDHVVKRVKKATKIDIVIVATTTNTDDDEIVNYCRENGFDYYRGSRDDVLSRFFETARQFNLDTILRITSDCPFVDPDTIDQLISAFEKGRCDYISNVLPGERTYPRGLDCEVFSFQALQKANANAKEVYEREHVTPYIHENKNGEFRIGPMVEAHGIYARPEYRLTLDYREDYEVISQLYDAFYSSGNIISVAKVLAFLDEHPGVAQKNAMREKEYPRRGIRK